MNPSSALLQLLSFGALAFALAMTMTPFLAGVLYHYRLGKRIRNSGNTPVFSKLHRQKEGTPTMGGILIWGTTAIIVFALALASALFPNSLWSSWNVLSRSQTYLPFGFLLAAAAVGMLDDILNIRGIGAQSGGLRMRHRLLLYAGLGAIGALWFVLKLEWTRWYVPWYGFVDIGWWGALLFILVIIATGFSVNEADGLDGLAGGVLLTNFIAFATIAFLQGKFQLASFIGIVIGSLLAFLWFNIHPARFFMGDTGAMSLGVTLGVVAVLTHSALYLPVIALVLVLESLSVILQIASRRVFHRKIFLSTPFHHHFEAKGWGEPKIVMRFWVISAIAALFGVVLVLSDPFFPRVL